MSEYDMLGNQGKVDLHVPAKCSACGGRMVYRGIGEYACEDCGHTEFDDYGKVRNFLETHPNSTAFEVEAGTGVKREAIARLLDEDRIQEKPYTRSELGKLI